ncbi:copper resistance CopC family protein [Pseudonocardia sp. T1-2H]|uniref:copper resistance CopC family protein n=1 Tax=Pseudonocardia sp. T1-2H TaxID=3128899 RepID=UPI003101370E
MRRFAVALALVIAALVAGAGVASAHNVLIGSDPPDGATLTAGPAQVRLTFDLPVREGFATVTVVGPGGTRWEDGAPVVYANTVSEKVRPLGPAGVYQVGYRIVSDDGHPVSGAIRFTLTTPGAGTPNPAPAAGSGGTSGGIPLWPFLVGGVVLLVGGVVVALRLGRGPDERVRRGPRTPRGRSGR